MPYSLNVTFFLQYILPAVCLFDLIAEGGTSVDSIVSTTLFCLGNHMHLICLCLANELMRKREEDLEKQKSMHQQQLEQFETDHNCRMQVSLHSFSNFAASNALT